MGNPDLRRAGVGARPLIDRPERSLRLARLRIQAVWQRARQDTLDLAGSAARRLPSDAAPRRRFENALTRWQRPAAPRMAPLLKAFGEQRPSGVFVQIGTNDDPDRAPLRQAIQHHRWAGLVVEPRPASLAQLRQTYPHLPEEAFEPAAFAPEEGRRSFYHLVAGAEDELKPHCLPFASLVASHAIESFDVLQIDVGDYAESILEQIDFDRFRPPLIVYESRHLTPAARTRCARRLGGFGYDTLEHGADAWCLRPAALQPSEAALIEPIWRWTEGYFPDQPLRPTAALRAVAQRARRRAGPDHGALAELVQLTEAERRYLASGYDDRTPLPPEAAGYLTADNRRLTELRRVYAALDLPALHREMWRPARMAESVELRYFRGDNLYQRHYPEHPRAMALALFIYMRYLERRGGRSLLERLSEDGAFGCWTAEISGFGKVSHDLLDSVNEILFLDRQLGVLGWRELRVLDIGAGYGRLAHRMAVALPSLMDYCCVDAVAESTFLCEYYLAFRGCSPPARALPLTHVETGLAPGAFDLAVNVHSFSECTLSAIQWWAGQLARLRVPYLLVVPNQPEGLVSREPDGEFRTAMPVLEAAGYGVIAQECVLGDAAVRELVRINDNFYLFAFSGCGDSAHGSAV